MRTVLRHKENEYRVLDYPKWKRMGKVLKPGAFNYNKPNLSIEIPSGLKSERIMPISCSDSDLFDVYYSGNDKELKNIETLPYGSDKKYITENETNFNVGTYIEIGEGVKESKPIILHYSVSEEANNLIDHNYIYVGKNSEVEVVIKYDTEADWFKDDRVYYHNGLTKLYVCEGASLKISKVQVFNDQVIHIDNSVSFIEDKGSVKFAATDLGSKDLALNYYAYLAGEKACAETVTAYFGDGDRHLDMGYNSVHKGRYSNSLIECHGALLDSSKKVFRGNLKFEKGAKKSVGKEAEYVLLLDKRVHSDAIPALLCDEDDVVGEHAASAGQVNEEQLYYLMSRGFSENEAKKLIIHGSFTKVLDMLPIDELKEEVEKELERRLLSEK